MIKINLLMPIATIFLLKVLPETQFGYLNSALSFSLYRSLFARMYVCIYTYISAYRSIFVVASKHVFVVSVAFVLPAHEVPVPLGCRASYVRLLSLHRMWASVCVSVCGLCLCAYYQLFHKVRIWGMFCVPSLFWFAVDKETIKAKTKNKTKPRRRDGNGNKIYSHIEPIYFNFISHLDGASCAPRIRSVWLDGQLRIVFFSCKCVYGSVCVWCNKE